MESCTVLDIGKEVFKGSLEKRIIYHLGKYFKYLHESISSYIVILNYLKHAEKSTLFILENLRM